MDSQALPYITLLGLLWGTNLVVSRFGLAQFDALAFIGLRLALATLAFAIIYQLNRGRRWPTARPVWRHALVLGALGTAIPMIGIIGALQYLSSGMTAIFVTANPAVTVLLAHLFLPDESLTLRKGTGVILALGGALLLAFSGESGLPDIDRANPLGFIMVMVGVLFVSGTAIYTRKYMRGYDTFDVSAARMVVATVIVMLLATFLTGFDFSGVTGAGYFSLLYAALIGTFAGLLLEFWIIQRFGATAAAVTAYIIPIVATVGGVIALGEQIVPIMLVGMGLIIFGIALINRRRLPLKDPPLSQLP